MNHVEYYSPSSLAGAKTPSSRGASARSWVLFWVLIVISSAILFVRFRPNDLAGWISETLGVTLGVPYLFASFALFLASRLIWDIDSRSRKVARGTACFAGVIALFGICLLFTRVS